MVLDMSYFYVSIPLGTINTKMRLVPSLPGSVSIPLGTINTVDALRKMRNVIVSIPLGTINTSQ